MTNKKPSRTTKGQKSRGRSSRPSRGLSSLETRHARLVNRVRVLEELIGVRKLKDDPKYGPKRSEEGEELPTDHWDTSENVEKSG